MPVKRNTYQLSPLRIALTYALIGGLWIAFSDTLLSALVADKDVITRLSIYKGWLFVIVTGGLLYWLVGRYAVKQESEVNRAERLNKLYSVIIKISEAILRIKDPQTLFSEACRLAVEEGGLRMAWIGLVDETDKSVRLVASYGVVDGYLDRIRISIDPDIPEGQGPTGTAIREDRMFICNDIGNDPRMRPWKEQAFRHGYRSSAAFPLKSESRIVGSLNLYASGPSYFDNEEIMLIETLAADISLAIESIRHEEERFKAEEALREREERLSSVIEQAPVGIAFSRDGVTLDANKVFLNMFGYADIQELRGKPLIDQIAPQYRPEVLDRIKQRAQGKAVEAAYETMGLRQDGSRFPFYVSVSRVVLFDGPVTISFFIDITERKLAEEALQRNEQVLRLFVEHSPAAIAMFDRDMKYIVASRRFLMDYDLGERNIIGRSHYEVFPEISGRWEEIHQRCLAGAVEKNEEDPFPREHGKMDWVRWEIRPWYETQNNIGGIILFSEVITERKRAEEELKKHREHLEELIKDRTAALQDNQRALTNIVEDLNQKTKELEQANVKLKEVDRLKSLFIASMSHELRTPLNSIIGFTGILLQGLAGPMNEEQKKQLGMVKSSSQHLLSLITDIIDLSKIEAGKIDLSMESFDLSQTVNVVMGSFQVAAEGKALKLNVDVPKSLVITSDPRRVRQVLVNLVGNAVKFTERGAVNVSVGKKNGMVEVSVRDTGQGIREEDMDKLFRSFSQVTTTNMPKHEGTGLGLYLSRKLVNLLGGELRAESEFGKGSVFSFTLPVKREEIGQ